MNIGKTKIKIKNSKCVLLDECGIYRSSTEHEHNARWAYGVRTDINVIFYYCKEELTYVRPILSLT